MRAGAPIGLFLAVVWVKATQGRELEDMTG
jgi:hypothetical protein